MLMALFEVGNKLMALSEMVCGKPPPLVMRSDTLVLRADDMHTEQGK